VPLNDETRGLLDDDLLRRVKKGAFLLNVSRGGVIDEADLAKALVEGQLAGAALDVFESEPLDPESPLRTAPNLVLTPHIGASTEEAQVAVAREVAIAVRQALIDGVYQSAVNAHLIR
jgi:phosphoglycerate dehydrogenase-like enzyme